MRLYEDVRALQVRVGVLQYLGVLGMALLLAYFWYLQVLRGRYYRELAENNRTRTISLAAPRGTLLDRHGHVLVENRPSFNVVLPPEHLQVTDQTVARLAHALQIGEAQIRERLAKRTPLRPVVVKADVSIADVAAVEARRFELQEARVDVIPLRSYPLALAAAHTLGRVGEVTDRQLQSREFAELSPGDLVGQAGVELQHNKSLMGQDGRRRVVVNSRGIEVAEAERVPPVVGPSLTLTLDAELQKAMDDAFASLAGSAVALDPETGEVLAMTSVPSYDPNEFATGIDAVLWGRLSTHPGTPLMNRVIQGQYAPGSVFKIVMAVAGLEEGVISPATTVYCPGYLSIYNSVFRCSKATGHGVVDIQKALTYSCNVFFYQLGVKLEIERIAAYARRMGLGAVTGIDLPHEAAGLVPDGAWKLRAFKQHWYPGETVSVAIGQGQLTSTPLQLARLAAVIANGGKLLRPHLTRNASREAREAPLDLGLKPQTLEIVKAGMAGVVAVGTGARARLAEVLVAGKTGTSQIVSHARLTRGAAQTQAFQTHAWFVAFAPVEKPRIALAVLVEHGGAGGEAAAPVARKVLAQFFNVATPAPMLLAGAVADPER